MLAIYYGQMDPEGAAIGIVTLVLFICAATIFSLWWHRQRKLEERAKRWPSVTAAIQEAAVETVNHGSKGIPIQLPSFAFSFVVNGDYYSGRFSLIPSIESHESVVQRLNGTQFTVKYDPADPNRFFIPENQWPGCEVRQPLSPHLIRLYAVD